MKQGHLFDGTDDLLTTHEAYERSRDLSKGAGNANSAAAHADLGPRKGAQKGKVLEAVVMAGGRGLTREEIADATGMLLQSVCMRVVELKKEKRIEEVDRPGRKTRSGKTAGVLIAKLEDGHALYGRAEGLEQLNPWDAGRA